MSKKYISLNKLSIFLDNLKNMFALSTHKHALSDIIDYKVDSSLSSSSTNPVQNKVLNSKFNTINANMDALETAIDGKADGSHNHDNSYDTKGLADNVQKNLDVTNDTINTHIGNSNVHVTTTNKSNWNTAYTHSQSTHARTDATKVTDSTTNGNILINGTETNVYAHPNSGVSAGTYKSVTVNTQGHITSGSNPTTLSGYGITDAETKTDASKKLTEAKTYADNAANKVKNDLLNGAGSAYDTLKELGNLIDDNTDAIDALEIVAAGKANKSHTHAISDVTNLQSTLNGIQTQLDERVSISRTINGKALSSNISLSASDVGASPSGHTHSYLPLSGGNLTGGLGIGNKYELNPAYNYTNGCLIDIGAAKSSTMVVIHITGNSYNGSLLPINSLFQFYDYGDGTLMQYSGVNLGLSLGNMTAYRYNNRLYAYIKQTASYQTLSFTIITNKSGLSPTVANTAAHTSGYTDLITITPKNISLDGHTHNYAGSSSAGGSANSAVKATQDASGNVITSTYATKTELNTAKTNLQTSINGKANSSHTHTIENITNLQTTLDGKSSTSHTHNYAGSSSVGGSATSANKLATARTISLTGDVTGSTSFDGSGNVSITTTVSDDSHNHVISNIDNLQTTLDAKLPKSGGTVGTLVGSSTITANDTLSGNSNTKTPFTTTTDLYFVNKKLTWNNASYLQHVILLFPVLTTTNWFGYNYIDGKFLCWKNGGNVYDTVEISANCVYNSLRYHLEYFGDNPSWSLCICKYNGVSYYALNCPYHANPYTNVEFIGHIKSDLTGGTSTVSLPLDVPYYNENSLTVLNEEVKNSITSTLTTSIVTSASGTPLYSKNGFAGSLSGNATSATTASSCTGNSATATKLSSAKTISLTGDVSGSTSFDGSGNVSITTTVADDSHNHIISNIDSLQSVLDGKSATSHTHTADNLVQWANALFGTTSNGGVEYSYGSNSGKNVLTEISNMGQGLHTVYAISGTAGNPKSNESFRFLIHKTSTTIGWILAWDAQGSLFTNYQSAASTFKGWKCVYDANPSALWTGGYYMSSSDGNPQTVKPSKKLSECRNGWVLIWSDYDPDTSTKNNTDIHHDYVFKKNCAGANWSGQCMLCDIPRYMGSNAQDVDTERRILKAIYIHDDRIEGSYQGSYDERNDVILRAVYEF